MIAFIVMVVTSFTKPLYANTLSSPTFSFVEAENILSFSLSTDGNKINLEWELDSTSSIESMSIERSINNNYFKSIQEFSNVYQQGFYSDFITNTNQKTSQIRYRLVVHYKNGKEYISESKQIQLKKTELLKPTIISTLSQIEINFSSGDEVNTEVQFFNTTGREVFKKNFIAKKGENLYSVDSSNFRNGLYFVRITQGNAVTTTKFFVR